MPRISFINERDSRISDNNWTNQCVSNILGGLQLRFNISIISIFE